MSDQPATEQPPKRRRRQEQEPASAEIAEMGPGILRLQIPINFTGLGHVNSYALIDDRGAAIVDAGLPGKETWAAIKTRLRDAGLRLSDVHTVLITHSHPDHFGSAGRLAHAAGAGIVAERRFHTWFERPPRHSHGHGHGHGHGGGGADACLEPATGTADDDADDGEKPEEDDTGYFNFTRTRQTPWGGTTWPVNRRQRITRILATRNLVPSQRPPIPTKRVSHGDRLTLAGREWVAIHTPGHTGDHLCLYDPTEQLLISGDHVLPTITPHVGGISPLRDPLGSFIASLALLRDIGPVKTVLPAHGYPISDMRARIDQIVQHHDDRLVQLREIGADLGEKGGTVVEISQRLFRQPLWGMMSESETYAHLEFLRLRGDAERFRVGDQLGYRVDPGGTSSAAAAAVSPAEAEAEADRSRAADGDGGGGGGGGSSPDLEAD